ncbi:MAG: asparaginase [Selenomonadaceae bacterium]|nr:asparaginase [Selenomonadaceae bacterium]
MAQKKKICVIATGGTIASVPGPGGLRPGLPGERLLELAPGVAELADVDCVNLMALDSSNLLPEHWQKMAKAIAERRENYDGFVVTHGTDTMAYSAGALFLMLENIDRPVILTGAQLPMDAPGTDAARNVLAALHAALSGRPGVYLAFAGNLHAGGAVRKLYSRQLAGFGSIDRPVAAIFKDGCYEWQWQQPKTDGAFRLATDLDDHIAVLKLVPGTDPALLKLMVDAGYHAIIIEDTAQAACRTATPPRTSSLLFPMQRKRTCASSAQRSASMTAPIWIPTRLASWPCRRVPYPQEGSIRNCSSRPSCLPWRRDMTALH